jgi:hypothetical protein
MAFETDYRKRMLVTTPQPMAYLVICPSASLTWSLLLQQAMYDGRMRRGRVDLGEQKQCVDTPCWNSQTLITSALGKALVSIIKNEGPEGRLGSLSVHSDQPLSSSRTPASSSTFVNLLCCAATHHAHLLIGIRKVRTLEIYSLRMC